jgi:hypothetical protein
MNSPISRGFKPTAGPISGASTAIAVAASEVKAWIASVTTRAVRAVEAAFKR